MTISSQYICPIRGLYSLEPPDPERLSQAGKVAADLGVTGLILNLQEEPVHSSGRTKISYLDGIIKSLDSIADMGLKARLIAPARRILGLDWVPPYLVREKRDPKGIPVFLEGRIRSLSPYNWWEDLSVIHRRLALFGEICSAISGHDGLGGWIIMDRELNWIRPDNEVADLVCKSYLASIREKDENVNVCLGLHWTEFLYPEIALNLAAQVDGVRISGLEQRPDGFNKNKDLGEELLIAAFFNAMSTWLFKRSSETETGWGMMKRIDDPDEVYEIIKRLSKVGLFNITWLNLMEPGTHLLDKPPWIMQAGLEKIGLLDKVMEPKEHVEAWLRDISDKDPDEDVFDFIDISLEEYQSDTGTHFPRLWDHFREMIY